MWINVEGTKFLDHKTLIQLSTLKLVQELWFPVINLLRLVVFLWNKAHSQMYKYESRQFKEFYFLTTISRRKTLTIQV